jgi:hypothetical protein
VRVGHFGLRVRLDVGAVDAEVLRVDELVRCALADRRAGVGGVEAGLDPLEHFARGAGAVGGWDVRVDHHDGVGTAGQLGVGAEGGSGGRRCGKLLLAECLR